MTLRSRGVLQLKRAEGLPLQHPSWLRLPGLPALVSTIQRCSQHWTFYWSFFTRGGAVRSSGGGEATGIWISGSAAAQVSPQHATIKGSGSQGWGDSDHNLVWQTPRESGLKCWIKEAPRWEGRWSQEVECWNWILGINVRRLGGSSERSAEFPQDAVSHPSIV